jgi:hypothetical protein
VLSGNSAIVSVLASSIQSNKIAAGMTVRIEAFGKNSAGIAVSTNSNVTTYPYLASVDLTKFGKNTEITLKGKATDNAGKTCEAQIVTKRAP